MNHAILKQNIAPFGLNKPAGNYNQSESNVQKERNDVTHSKQNTHTLKKAPFAIVNTTSRSIHYQFSQHKINHNS